MTLPHFIAFLGTAALILAPLCLPPPRRPRLDENGRVAPGSRG